MLATPTPTRAPRPASWLHRWLQGMGLVQEVNTMAEAGRWWPIRAVQWVVPTTKSHCLLHLLMPWTVALCPFHQWTTGKHIMGDSVSLFIYNVYNFWELEIWLFFAEALVIFSANLNCFNQKTNKGSSLVPTFFPSSNAGILNSCCPLVV